MQINTIDKKAFEIIDDSDKIAGSLVYTSSAFEKAIIETDIRYLLHKTMTGIWITKPDPDKNEKIKCRTKVETGGVMSVRLNGKGKKYFFKKSAGWKLRFSLANGEGEDLLTLLPTVNWQKETHDYILQLNEEFENECDSFLILQAVHCANCSLSMMTGGKVPALISI